MHIKQAMDILISELKNDQGYFMGWQANIAMPIYDLIAAQPGCEALGKETIHRLCNEGAKNFLELLTYTPKEETAPVAPLNQFADIIERMENPKDEHTVMGNIFREGDRVCGTWVNIDGRSYSQEGTIIRNEKTGLWVQSQPDGGITEIKRFYTLYHKVK